MIDIEDLMVIAGIILSLVVAFHYGTWPGLATLSGYLIIGGLVSGKAKAQQKGKK